MSDEQALRKTDPGHFLVEVRRADTDDTAALLAAEIIARIDAKRDQRGPGLPVIDPK